MTPPKDANQIAQETARRENTVYQPHLRLGAPAPKPVRGTLTVWQDVHRMMDGDPFLTRSLNVVLDLSRAGLIIAYDEEANAEIFAIAPGWYIHFVPNVDEGE